MSCSVKGQNPIDCMQGFWKGVTMDIEPYEDISDLYQIVYNDSIYSFYLSSNKILTFQYKFVDFDPELKSTNFYEVKSINTLEPGSVPNKDYYYFEIDEDGNQSMDKYYSCNGNELTLLHLIYEKQSFVSYSVYSYLKSIDPEYLKKINVLKQIKIAEIKVDKAYFHNQPNEDTKRKAFVIKGDEVIIDEIKDGWYRVAYEGEKITTEGWIKANDLEILK